MVLNNSWDKYKLKTGDVLLRYNKSNHSGQYRYLIKENTQLIINMAVTDLHDDDIYYFKTKISYGSLIKTIAECCNLYNNLGKLGGLL